MKARVLRCMKGAQFATGIHWEGGGGLYFETNFKIDFLFKAIDILLQDRMMDSSKLLRSSH